MNWPTWFTPRKGASRLNLAVARGLHPMGMRLAGNGETCGTCAHRVTYEANARYYKCAKTRQSRSLATDVRLRWPAC